MGQAEPLAGKVALVTGGARRIGRAIALALARSGADVVITFRNSQAEAVHTAGEIENLGRRALVLECDVRSESNVRTMIAGTIAEFGQIDIVVNNAGIFQSAALDEITLEAWDEVFETNTRGPFLVSREALPHLKAQNGRIINLGSLGGLKPWVGHGHYCASKAALHMLTQVMAKAFAPEVTVNCVAPGWIEMVEDQAETSERFARKTPLARNGTAEDVAEAVLYFATGAGFVTGEILTVDGGLGL